MVATNEIGRWAVGLGRAAEGLAGPEAPPAAGRLKRPEPDLVGQLTLDQCLAGIEVAPIVGAGEGEPAFATTADDGNGPEQGQDEPWPEPPPVGMGHRSPHPRRHGRQRQVDRGEGVELRRREPGPVDVVRPDQELDLGAAGDHPSGPPVDQAVDDLAIGPPGLLADDPP